MPSKSDRQRRYLEREFGHAWVKAHYFDKVKGKKKTTPRRKARKG